MAKKDVDLVIRAKDQAQGVVKSITDALEKFVGAQADVQKTALKTDSSLDRLSTGLVGLQKALGGVTAANKVNAELQRAQQAITKMSKATAEAAGEAIGYARESRQAARATQELRQENERVSASMVEQTAKVKAAKAARSELNSVTRTAAADSKKLAAADQQLTNQIEEQRLKLALAGAAYRDLQTEIAATSGPTKRLEDRLSAVSRVVRETEGTLSELKTTQAVVQNSFDATARSVERAQTAYGSTAATVDRQVAALTRLKATQTELNGAVRVSAQAQAKLESSASKAANALANQTGNLQASEAGFKELSTAAKSVDAALSEVESRVRGPLLRSFGEQATRVAKLKQEYLETSDQATRLGRALASTANPSKKLVAAFDSARDAAARSRTEYREQNSELAILRRVLRETGGDVDTFANRQERFAATLDRAGASYAKYATNSQRAATASARAAGAAQQATGSVGGLAGGYRNAGNAAGRAAAQTNTLAGAVRNFYGESRKALSFTQRLRGEVLSLVAAYGGFFAAVEGIRSVIGAYQALEAAQSRLNVVFNGDQSATANELDFIRRNAERLGVEFGSLAQEYTKFAVATKGTNLAGEETRRIFISIAEAARVNKSTLPELQGVFVAITQIVNKGTVSMEELRQQLGDRLPGAIQIMADAARVGVADLTKMIEQGKLSSDILSEFADELDGRFSQALPAALETTTTALGKLQNALFQAFLRVANGGFIQAFTDLLNDLATTLQSAEFLSFLDRLSVGLAGAADVVAFLARNFDVLSAAIVAFIGFKLAPFVIFLAGRFGVLTGSTVTASRGFRALAVAANSSTVSMSRTAVAVRGVTLALRTLMSATGIGLLVTAIGAGIGLWATSADDGTEALQIHKDVVDTVRNAYDELGGSLEGVQAALKAAFTTTDLVNNVSALKKELTSVLAEFIQAQGRGGGSFSTRFFGVDLVKVSKEYRDSVQSVLDKTRDGELDMKDFAKNIDEVNETFRDGSEINERFAAEVNAAAKKVVIVTDALGEADKALTIAEGSTEDAARALVDLSGATEDAASAMDEAKKRYEEFGDAIATLRGLVPGLTEELEFLNEKAKLKDALDAALQLAQTYGQVAAAVDLYNDALSQIEGNQALQVLAGVDGGARGKAFALIVDKEGFLDKAEYDVNAYRLGYGSDKMTDINGVVTDVTANSTTDEAGAIRDLTRRLGEFMSVIEKQIGADRFQSFNDDQQAALTSIAYNYGSLPGRIVDAIKTGNTDTISNAINALGTDNDGINAKRRKSESDIFRTGGAPSIQPYIDAETDRAKLAEDAAEDAKGRADATRQAIADGAVEISQQELISAGREREAAIQEAINSAKQDNVDIGAAELAQIEANAGKLFDLKKAEEDRLTPLEQAEAAEQRVADIMELQKSLKEQLNQAITAGADDSVTGGLRTELEEVNAQLTDATANAIQMFEALNSSSPAVGATISQLQLLQAKSGEVAGKIKIDWKQVETQFAGGLVNAIDSFVQGMFEGKSAAESARDAFLQFAADFLRQIAMMILQQVALNIVRGVLGGIGVPVGVAHSGAIVGQRTAARRVDPAAFAGAMRYHSGGIAGLKPNEVPTILERNEEVLTTGDPRHKFNGGKSAGTGGGNRSLRIVNVFDAVELVKQALAQSAGEEVLVNRIRASKGEIRAALDI